MSGEEFFHLFDAHINELKGLIKRAEAIMELEANAVGRTSKDYKNAEWNYNLYYSELKELEKLIILPAYLRVKEASNSEFEEYKNFDIESLSTDLNILRNEIKKIDEKLSKNTVEKDELATKMLDENSNKTEIQASYNKITESTKQLEKERDEKLSLCREKKEQLEKYQNQSITVIKEEMLAKITHSGGYLILSYIESILSQDDEALAYLAIHPDKVEIFEKLVKDYKTCLDNKEYKALLASGITYNYDTDTIEIQQAVNVTESDIKQEKGKLGILENYYAQIDPKKLHSFFSYDKIAPLYKNFLLYYTDDEKEKKDYAQYTPDFFREYLNIVDIGDLIKENEDYEKKIRTNEQKLFKTRDIKNGIVTYKINVQKNKKEMIAKLKNFYNAKAEILMKLGIIDKSFEEMFSNTSSNIGSILLGNISVNFATVNDKIKQRLKYINDTQKEIEMKKMQELEVIIGNINELITSGNFVFNQDTFSDLLKIPISLRRHIVNKGVNVGIFDEINKAKEVIKEEVAKEETRITAKKSTTDEKPSPTTNTLKEIIEYHELQETNDDPKKVLANLKAEITNLTDGQNQNSAFEDFRFKPSQSETPEYEKNPSGLFDLLQR